jgi:copper(I)-binding protein
MLVMLATALASGALFAHDYQLRGMHVSNPFARATPPGASVAGAFMSIENQGTESDRLTAVTSPVAGAAALHEMAMDGGLMKMHAVKGIELKPGAKVDLRPGGYHIMLEGLKRPFKQGEEIPLTLTFEKAGAMQISVKVEAMGATAHTH